MILSILHLFKMTYVESDMNSSRGKPLTPEIKKIFVSVKQYFDQNKLTPKKLRFKRTTNALGIGKATVKRMMTDYNRLDEPTKMRGHPSIAHNASSTRRFCVNAASLSPLTNKQLSP